MTTDADACPAPRTADSPGDTALVTILSRVKSVAVVGASPNPERTSHQIALWLMNNTPYEVYLVNPHAADEEILGHGFFPDLASLPVVPDLVDAFRAPVNIPDVAVDARAVGAPTLWMQLGIRHDAAAFMCLEAGMDVIQNRCLKVEYRRLAERIEVARAVRG